MVLNNLNYPLDFKFKITTLASDFNITDRNGNYVAYVRQKMFKLKEDVIVFNDESKSKELFRIKANQWIDFNASYSLTEIATGRNFGRMARKGMRSLWKASYDILDANDQPKFKIQEDSAWVRFFDGLVGEIPLIGAFTGYFLNPTYTVTGTDGKEYFKLKKMPFFLEEDFSLTVSSILMMKKKAL